MKSLLLLLTALTFRQFFNPATLIEEPLPENLILAYTFEKEPVRAIPDASRHGHTATLRAGHWVSAPTPTGGAIAFKENEGQGITLQKCPPFTAWEAYTISIWFLNDGQATLTPDNYGQKLLDKTTMYHDFHLGIAHPGNIRFVLFESGRLWSLIDSDQNYADSAWHHLVAIRNGPYGYLWADGQLKRSCANMAPVFSTAPLCLGNSHSTDTFQRTPWSGQIGPLHIFDRALTPEEITRLHQTGTILKQEPPQ